MVPVLTIGEEVLAVGRGEMDTGHGSARPRSGGRADRSPYPPAGFGDRTPQREVTHARRTVERIGSRLGGGPRTSRRGAGGQVRAGGRGGTPPLPRPDPDDL